MGIGAEALEFASETDPFYDPDANAWLLATISYDVTGVGTTDLFLQIGDQGVMAPGGDDENATTSADISLIFGGGSGPGDGSMMAVAGTVVSRRAPFLIHLP